MADLFSIKTVFFTLWGYPMSYLEFVGTLLNVWSVWLVAKSNMLTWPVGIVAVILFGILFYQIQLYSDLVEQVYFLFSSIYGWSVWLRKQGEGEGGKLGLATPSRTSFRDNQIYAGVILAGTCALGGFMARVHVLLPGLFPQPASYPLLDAFTTVMSFAAMILMAHRKIECWYLWIAVDVIGIGLYYAKGVVFVSLLYATFLGLATRGLLNWRNECAAAGRTNAVAA